MQLSMHFCRLRVEGKCSQNTKDKLNIVQHSEHQRVRLIPMLRTCLRKSEKQTCKSFGTVTVFIIV